MPAHSMNVDEFFRALKSGQTFATNGPLLDFSLGGAGIGGDVNLDGPEGAVTFRAKMQSIAHVDHLDIVCNGAVVKSLADKIVGTGGISEALVDVSGTIPLKESGWCLLRASSDKAEYPVLDNYVYATTSPIYVTVEGKKARSQEDAKYFAAWIQRTIEITGEYPDWNSAAEKAYVMGRLSEAKKIFEEMR
jgi:hypothetical protein